MNWWANLIDHPPLGDSFDKGGPGHTGFFQPSINVDVLQKLLNGGKKWLVNKFLGANCRGNSYYIANCIRC